MNIFTKICERIADAARERRIRRLCREMGWRVTAAGFLRREADEHSAEAREIYAIFVAEIGARSIAQLRRMVARQLKPYRDAGDHEIADKLAAGYEEDFAAKAAAAAGRGPKTVRVGDMIERDAAGIDRWKHSGNSLPDVFQTLPMATTTKH